MQAALSPETIKNLIAYSLDKSGSQKTFHITRIAMYKALHHKFATMDAKETKVLSISSPQGFGSVLGLLKSSYTFADFPDQNMLDLKYDGNTFDCCVSDQVLEHVEGDPFRAFSESVRVVKPGGWVCHTTCLINPVHGVPKDFWRFTPDALRLLARSNGLTGIEAAGWGNREVWAIIDAGFRFAAIPDEPTHPLYQIAMKNDINWPVAVWVVGQKPT